VLSVCTLDCSVLEQRLLFQRESRGGIPRYGHYGNQKNYFAWFVLRLKVYNLVVKMSKEEDLDKGKNRENQTFFI